MTKKPPKTPQKVIVNHSKNHNLFLIALLLFNVMAPIIFVWVVEITMEPRQDVIATNGFWTMDTLKLYHIAMYIMIITTFLTSLHILDRLTLYKIAQIRPISEPNRGISN